MNKETYEALKRIVERVKEVKVSGFNGLDLQQIESWIEEVEKEYADEPKTGELVGEEGLEGLDTPAIERK